MSAEEQTKLSFFSRILLGLEELKQAIRSNAPKEIQKVKIVYDTEKFAQAKIGRCTSSSNSRPLWTAPSLTIQNPIDDYVAISEISIVPDVNFQTLGMIIISVNDVELYSNTAVADFTDVIDDVTIFKGGKTIKPKDKINVYIWNGTNTSAIACTVKVLFGEATL